MSNPYSNLIIEEVDVAAFLPPSPPSSQDRTQNGESSTNRKHKHALNLDSDFDPSQHSNLIIEEIDVCEQS